MVFAACFGGKLVFIISEIRSAYTFSRSVFFKSSSCPSEVLRFLLRYEVLRQLAVCIQVKSDVLFCRIRPVFVDLRGLSVGALVGLSAGALVGSSVCVIISTISSIRSLSIFLHAHKSPSDIISASISATVFFNDLIRNTSPVFSVVPPFCAGSQYIVILPYREGFSNKKKHRPRTSCVK